MAQWAPGCESYQMLSDLHKVSEDVLRSSYDRTSEILASHERRGHAQESRDFNSTNFVLGAVREQGGVNLGATERVADTLRDATGLLGTQAERLMNENQVMHASNDRHLSGLIDNHHYQNGRDYGHIMREFCKVEGRLTRDILHSRADAADRFCKLELQAANNFGAIQLEAMRNRTDILQKLEECCCEVKERVSTSEANVKDLIKTVDAERLRDALKTAETKNLIFEFGRGGGHGGN
jgi:hypothetical protein